MIIDEPHVDILGVRFARLGPEDALARVEALYMRDAPASAMYVNAHTLNLAHEDAAYLHVLKGADLVLNDGKGVLLAARMYGRPFPADLNGNFFTPLLLERAALRGWPTFFFGARPGVAESVAEQFRRRRPSLDVVGVRDGYSRASEAVVDDIRSSGAGLLLVALGNPLQERWLHENLASTGARLGVGVGAFFDFQAGTVKRAPAWMNRLGIEWVHRLALEPRRMWRRYVIGNPVFLTRAFTRRGGGSSRGTEPT